MIPVGNMKGTPPRGSVGIAWKLLPNKKSATREAGTVTVACQKTAKKHTKHKVWSGSARTEGTVVSRESNDDQVDDASKKLAQQEAGAAQDDKG